MHRATQKTLEMEFEEEFVVLKQIYSKYRGGYAKLSEYLKDKLWPEECLFRERFGCLPEFPPEDEAQTDEARPESTIKYWQDKLHEREVDYRALRTELHKKNEENLRLEKLIEEQRSSLLAPGTELQDSHFQSVKLASYVKDLEDRVVTFENRLGDHKALLDGAEDLKRSLRDAEERRESLSVEHQIRLNSALEEIEHLKSELRTENSRLEETYGALSSAQDRIGTLSEAIASSEKSSQFRSGEETTSSSEKTALAEKVVGLETELSEQRKQNLQLQESILSLRNEVEKLRGKEADLEMREKQISLTVREVRRSKSSEDDMTQLMDEMKRLRSAVEEERDALAEKNVS